MDTHAESAADITPFAVTVYRREDADRIDKQHSPTGQVALRRQLRITQTRSIDLRDHSFDTGRIYLVRRQNKLDIRIRIDQRQ